MTHFFLMSSNSGKVISKDREIENKTDKKDQSDVVLENKYEKKDSFFLKCNL